MRKLLVCLGVVVAMAAGAFAQGPFSSGSTGVDGAFAPTVSATVQVPASGVFNYTTVSIPSGVTITYLPNTANTPVTILATGDIDINGTIILNGQPGSNTGFGGSGGPGGFSGGSAQSVQAASGNSGNGPGGGGGAPFNGSVGQFGDCRGAGGGGYGTAGVGFPASSPLPAVPGGASYGSPVLLQLIGGSGGGGGSTLELSNNSATGVAGGGGGGGGAILLASSTQIVFPSSGNGAGVISANGGSGAVGITNPSGLSNFLCGAGGGAGGAIHLVANAITGTAQFNVSGGSGGGGNAGGAGGSGYVRVDAFNLVGFNPTSSTLAVSSGTPNLPPPSALPVLQIFSVAGVSSPTVPSGSFQNAPDIVLPATQANPVTVVINSTNVPSGTTVTLTAVSNTGTTVTASGVLSGTTASSTVSVSISLPSNFSVLTASTTALVADGRPMFLNGERVEKIEVAASFGGPSLATYITQSGRRIRAAR
jgi:hypothetical protein